MTDKYGGFDLTWIDEREILLLSCNNCAHSFVLSYSFLAAMGKEAIGRLLVYTSKNKKENKKDESKKV